MNKQRIGIFLIIISTALVSSAHQIEYKWNFNYDSENWTYYNSTGIEMNFNATDGNPPGSLNVVSNSSALANATWRSPNITWTNSTPKNVSLAFDLKSNTSSGTFYVSLVKPDGTVAILYPYSLLNISNWTHFNISVLPNNFNRTGNYSLLLNSTFSVSEPKQVSWDNPSILITMPLNITSFAPNSPVNDTAGTTRTFNITTDQIVNVSWYLDGAFQKTDFRVNSSYYETKLYTTGIYSVLAVASNDNGSDNRSWVWNILPGSTSKIGMIAQPSTIDANNVQSSQINASLEDRYGNMVVNDTIVTFWSNRSTDTLSNKTTSVTNGSIVATTTNGIASIVVRGSWPGTSMIYAENNSKIGSVTVNMNIPTPPVISNPKAEPDNLVSANNPTSISANVVDYVGGVSQVNVNVVDNNSDALLLGFMNLTANGSYYSTKWHTEEFNLTNGSITTKMPITVFKKNITDPALGEAYGVLGLFDKYGNGSTKNATAIFNVSSLEFEAMLVETDSGAAVVNPISNTSRFTNINITRNISSSIKSSNDTTFLINLNYFRLSLSYAPSNVYRAHIDAVDVNGTSNTALVSFELDNTPPEINLSNPKSNETRYTDNMVEGNTSIDVVSAVLMLNNNAINLGLNNEKIFRQEVEYLPNSTNYINITVTDMAKNSRTENFTVFVKNNNKEVLFNTSANVTTVLFLNDTVDADLSFFTMNATNGSVGVTIETKGDNSQRHTTMFTPHNFTGDEQPAGRYIRINSSVENVTWAIIKMYYMPQDVDINNDGLISDGDLDERNLAIYYFNERSSAWEKLSTQVNNTRSNGFSGYAYVNLSHFSIFGLAAPSVKRQSTGVSSTIGMGGLPTLWQTVTIKNYIGLWNFTGEVGKLIPSIIIPDEKGTIYLEIIFKNPTKANLSKAYRYLRIDAYNLSEKQGTIVFQVNKKWIESAGLDKESIALYRFHNGKWNMLPTTHVKSLNEEEQFKATAPGFSYFAIGEKRLPETISPETTYIPEVVASPVALHEQEEMQQSASNNENNDVLLVLIPVDILVIGGIIISYLKKII